MKYSIKLAGVCALLCVLSAAFFVYAEGEPVLVRAKFVDKNTWRVECKGFPKAGTRDVQAYETAREAALTMAQAIAHDTFDDTVNTDACGQVVKYKGNEKYQIVIYEVKKAGLKSHAKKKINAAS